MLRKNLFSNERKKIMSGLDFGIAGKKLSYARLARVRIWLRKCISGSWGKFGNVRARG